MFLRSDKKASVWYNLLPVINKRQKYLTVQSKRSAFLEKHKEANTYAT